MGALDWAKHQTKLLLPSRSFATHWRWLTGPPSCCCSDCPCELCERLLVGTSHDQIPSEYEIEFVVDITPLPLDGTCTECETFQGIHVATGACDLPGDVPACAYSGPIFNLGCPRTGTDSEEEDIYGVMRVQVFSVVVGPDELVTPIVHAVIGTLEELETDFTPGPPVEKRTWQRGGGELPDEEIDCWELDHTISSGPVTQSPTGRCVSWPSAVHVRASG